MKGLLIKDLKLMANQKKFFLLVLLIAVMQVGVLNDTTFIISYLTFIASLFTLTTISYDEFDNGNAFLFSLPITRSRYVAEKYSFGLIVGGAAWLLSTLVAVIGGEIRKVQGASDTLIIAFAILPIIILILAIMIPFQLKFGGEKGRTAAIAATGVVVAVAVLAGKIADLMHFDFAALLDRLQAMDLKRSVAVVIGASVVAYLLSFKISISIMEKKEF